MTQQQTQVSRLLLAWRQGEPAALDQLIPLVHDELRRLADRYLRQERIDHSFDPTDLVHEAYLRLVDKRHPQWQDQAHFYAVAAQLMRRILVDHARGRSTAKRGGGLVTLRLDDTDEPVAQRAEDLVALDDALEALAGFDREKARVIELRYFGGLTIDETAEVLGLSPTTVVKNTRLARAWLTSEMRRAEA
ncbi:MAG: sigma-70 family RNA polymerase sigma factor [Acidobacteriota bacterium]